MLAFAVLVTVELDVNFRAVLVLKAMSFEGGTVGNSVAFVRVNVLLLVDHRTMAGESWPARKADCLRTDDKGGKRLEEWFSHHREEKK